MLALHELQRAVYRSLVQQDDGAIGAAVRTDGVAAADRKSIYRNTFYGTLTRALHLAFPAIHRLVGAEFFEAVAVEFIKGKPPRSAYLDDYGSGFPDFLARFPGTIAVPYLFDVARLEWSVNHALHAPDVMPLDLVALSAVPQSESEHVRFVRSPSVHLLISNYPADRIWRGTLDENDAGLATIDLRDAPVWLLIERTSSRIDVKRLTEAAYRFTSALFDGQPIAEAVKLACDIDASAVLAEHLSAGRFVAFSTTGFDD